jgi:hypothetical protein
MPMVSGDFLSRIKENESRRLVGAIGFEPTTPCAQGRCATRLRYAPTLLVEIDSKARRHFVPLGASSVVRVTAPHARVRASFTTLAAGKRNTGASPLMSIFAVVGTIARRCSNVLSA